MGLMRLCDARAGSRKTQHLETGDAMADEGLTQLYKTLDQLEKTGGGVGLKIDRIFLVACIAAFASVVSAVVAVLEYCKP